MTSLRSRINQSGRGRYYGNFSDVYSPDPQLKALKPEPTHYQPAPYIVQKPVVPRGSDPSLRYQLIARHKLPEVPVLRSNLVVPDVGGVLEVIPVSFKERQTASIVASLKKLAGESSGLFGGLASKIGQILNLNLSKAQIEKIDSINKADELSFLRDLQRVVLNQKEEEKPNIDKILGRIKGDGQYDALEEKQLGDLDAYLAGEEPKGEEKKEITIEPAGEEKKEIVIEPVVEEEKKKPTPPEGLSPRQIRLLAGNRAYGPPVARMTDGRDVFEKDGQRYVYNQKSGQFRQDQYDPAKLVGARRGETEPTEFAQAQDFQ